MSLLDEPSYCPQTGILILCLVELPRRYALLRQLFMSSAGLLRRWAS